VLTMPIERSSNRNRTIHAAPLAMLALITCSIALQRSC
jgi:hypothetical protein